MRTIYIPVIPWPNIVCKSTQKHCYQKIIHCIHNKFASTQRQYLEIHQNYFSFGIIPSISRYENQCEVSRYKHFPSYISLNAVTFVISVRQINIIKVSRVITLANQRRADTTPKILLAFSTISKIYRVGRGRGVLVSIASLIYRNNCHILHDPVYDKPQGQ